MLRVGDLGALLQGYPGQKFVLIRPVFCWECHVGNHGCSRHLVTNIQVKVASTPDETTVLIPKIHMLSRKIGLA